ncbi:unnamed protein product [Rotaria sp. Silwood2]|nr:unnamed protein product [Rotaria sp. Silwood2]CAF3385134.1 unnamed protein product [Rotaria sp. Silwood2]CAF4060469.1 unnamed protein product [Rotaria sp. Silwood2]CAF4564234.1 unnamed protein product [Rotaria sp. Silwood2]
MMNTDINSKATNVVFKTSINHKTIKSSLKHRRDSSSSNDENLPSTPAYCYMKRKRKDLVGVLDNSSNKHHKQHNKYDDEDNFHRNKF